MRRDKHIIGTATLAAVVLLVGAGCGSPGTSDGTRTGGTPTHAGASTEATTKATTGATSGPTGQAHLIQPISLVRSGGVGGLKDRLDIRPDATFTVTLTGQAPVTRRLTAAQLAAITTDMARADIAHLPSGSPTGSRSDQLTYLITVDGASFITTETAVPAVLRPLLDHLEALFSAPAPTP